MRLGFCGQLARQRLALLAGERLSSRAEVTITAEHAGGAADRLRACAGDARGVVGAGPVVHGKYLVAVLGKVDKHGFELVLREVVELAVRDRVGALLAHDDRTASTALDFLAF